MKKILILLTIISIGTLAYAQAPDPNCATAAPLTINGACGSGSITTNTYGGPAYTCFGTEQRIGYYTFTTGAAPQNISVAITANRDPAIQVFSGTCGGGIVTGCTNLSGNQGNAGSSTETLNFVSNPFTTYVVQVMDIANNTLVVTNACVTATPYVVPNDDPCTATSIPVLTSCSVINTTNISATASANPNPGCAGYAGGDVWYRVTVPSSGNVTIDTDDEVMLDGGLAVYSGPNCSTLSLLACDDNSSPNGLMGMLSIVGRPPGSTLWIRVWENGNNNNGAFGICAYDVSVSPPQDCSGAWPVCSDASFAGNASGFNNQELNAANRGCLSTNEHQSTWFGFSPVNSGTIQLNINPTAGAVDYDFAIWGPYSPGNNCPVVGNPIRCSYAAQTGTTGLQTGAGDNSEGAAPAMTPRFVNSLVITPAEWGKVYYLLVDNFASNNTPFTLGWIFQDTLGAPNPTMLDCTPPLPAELLSFNGNAFANYNQIHWATQSETNTSHFILEKSSDAQNFGEVNRTNGAGNSNMVINYNLTDPNPYPVTYYKLKQVDQNGDYKYYGPITIANNELSGLSVQKIYPNPADESFKIDLYSKDALPAVVYAYDSYGRLVYSKTMDVMGFNTYEIETSSWNPGVYIIKVVNDEHHFQQIEKVIIK